MTTISNSTQQIDLRRNALLLGSLSAAIQSILGIVVIGIGLPVLLTTLGKELYGVFAVVSVVSTLGTITSPGISGALLFHVGRADSRTDANHAILGNLTLSLVLGLLGLVGGLLFETTVLEDIFSLAEPLARPNVILYRYLLVCGALTTIGQSFVAMMDVQQKNHLSNFSQFIYSIVYWLLCTAFAALWHSLEALAYAVLIATILWFGLVTVLAIRSWGRIEISGTWRVVGGALVSQVRYGSQLFLAHQMTWLYEPFTKILIANTLGVANVATFDIAVRVKNQIWSVFAKMIYPINPLLASLRSEEQAKLIVTDTSRIILLLIVPISVAFGLAARSLYAAWFGAADHDLVLATVLMTCGHFLSLIGLPMYHFSVARGFAKHIIVVHLSNAVLNGVIYLSCYSFLSFAAAPLANAGATVLSLVYLLGVQRNRFGYVIPKSGNTILQTVVVSFICAVLGVLLVKLLKSDLLVLVLVPSVVAAVALLLYRWQDTFDPVQLELYFGNEGKLAGIVRSLLSRKLSRT